MAIKTMEPPSLPKVLPHVVDDPEHPDLRNELRITVRIDIDEVFTLRLVFNLRLLIDNRTIKLLERSLENFKGKPIGMAVANSIKDLALETILSARKPVKVHQYLKQEVPRGYQSVQGIICSN